jgi:hypothetical protein
MVQRQRRGASIDFIAKVRLNGSLLVTHDRPAIAAEIKNFGRFSVFGRLKAQVQENPLPMKPALEGQCGGMNVLTGAEAHRFRLEVVQKSQHVKVEAGPVRFAVLFASHDFLNGRVGPDFPEIVARFGLGEAESEL